MDLDTALHTALVDDDIKKHCHVNSNEDGDRCLLQMLLVVCCKITEQVGL